MTRQIKTLVACAFLFLSSIVFGASAQGITKSDTTEAQNVILDQLSAFIENDAPRAYSHAAPSIKKIFPDPNNFMAMVERGYGAIYRSTTHDFGRNRVEDGKIYQELILTGERGITWESIYALSKQDDGNWKIMGVQMRRSENSTL